jgi:hypothetical protein
MMPAGNVEAIQPSLIKASYTAGRKTALPPAEWIPRPVMNSIGQAAVGLHVSTDVQSLHRTALTVRSTVVYETLFSERDCLSSGGIVQIDDRTGRGGFSGGQ